MKSYRNRHPLKVLNHWVKIRKIYFISTVIDHSIYHFLYFALFSIRIVSINFDISINNLFKYYFLSIKNITVIPCTRVYALKPKLLRNSFTIKHVFSHIFIRIQVGYTVQYIDILKSYFFLFFYFSKLWDSLVTYIKGSLLCLTTHIYYIKMWKY